MSKILYTISWSAKANIYEIYQTLNRMPVLITFDSPAWFSWLQRTSSFLLLGKHGHYVLHKGTQATEEGFWYAYCVQQHRVHKAAFSTTSNLTLARLESLGQDVLPISPLDTLAAPIKKEATSLPLSPLLTTKLHAPRPLVPLVARPHLLEHIQLCVRYPLTLLSAPAGFGKTTLLAQWLQEDHPPTAWLSLEESDNDPTRFLSYMITALQTLNAHLGKSALAVLTAPQPAPPETVLSLLINEIHAYQHEDLLLVLDDYHLIISRLLHHAMVFFLEHLPPQLHLILATRKDPSLPLARLRARGQLLEVRIADLRFAHDDIQTFFQTVMKIDLPAEVIDTLEQRTEGWPVGLQLAGLSLQKRTDVDRFVRDLTGTQRFILDYLSEEVLHHQALPLQTFLLYTSLLDRLCGSLCDAVTGQADGQRTLEKLEEANLFVVALDENQVWYRYHHLFADALQSQLQRQEANMIPTLHRNASEWYEQHELPLEAIRHALAIPDIERAIRLIDAIIIPFSVLGQRSTVYGFLNALSDEVVRAHPILNIRYSSLLILSNQFDAAEARIQEVEATMPQDLPPEQARLIHGYILTNRSAMDYFLGNLAVSIPMGQQAHEIIKENEEFAYAGNLMHIAHISQVTGDVTPASEQEVKKTIAIIRPLNNPFAAVIGVALLAQMQMLQGRLRQAKETYAQVMQVVTLPEFFQTQFAGPYYYFGLGSLLREQNEREAAEWHLHQGLEMISGEVPLAPWIMLQGYTAMAWLQQTSGHSLEARATLNALYQLAIEQHFAATPVAQIAAEQARLALAQGNMTMVFSWVERCGCRLEDVDLPYPREREYLALARVQIVQYQQSPTSDVLPRVLTLLDRLQRKAEANGRQWSVLEILVVRALALEVLGEQEAAMRTLEQALVLAEPEGYIQRFLDEGSLMQSMLVRLQRHKVLSEYVGRLLKAWGEAQPLNEPAPAMIESQDSIQFTRREREILQLMHEGVSNQEIAHHLVISVDTAKRHVHNICGKLGVRSRGQAVARVRSLHLL